MPKRSSKVAPKGASCAKRSSKKASLTAHEIWVDQNVAEGLALVEKDKAGVKITPKEHEFLRWWVGYFTANPDPKRPPRFSASVIPRDKDPME
jgi:hypothetical protein